ncbi:sensor histidine kinase [Paenibacillus spiritus]|uniref:Sensor histidine kinase n=1 Tax=Paenibacillus spiritus TaxID=2496557 RepID=A0A5J5GA59_9BACL|nr:sensor histidine kinase [Paenibacillus spiritus]KAA9004840.1 sensor histidine kinase [Paenibacillus spiritus]
MFKHSIRSRLIALVLLAAVIPASVSVIFSYYFTRESVTRQSIAQNGKLLSLGAADLGNYFEGIDQRASSVYSGINVAGSFYTAILTAKNASGVPVSDTALPDNRHIMSSQLYNLYTADRSIFQIHLFIRSIRQSNTLLAGQFRQETNLTYRPQDNPDGTNRPFVEPAHPDHQYGVKSGFSNYRPGITPVFTLHYPVYKTPSDEILADLSIDFKLSELENISAAMYNAGTERLYIADERGQLLYAQGDGWVGQPLSEGWSGLPEDKESGHFSWRDGNFQGIVLYQHVDTRLFQGYIVKLVSYDELYTDARTITGINTGIGVLLVAVAGIAGVLISISFTRPIKKLIAYTQRVQIGQLGAHIEPVSEDEFGLLTRKITDMTRTINDLILNEYRLEIANKTNELKALQAQVNPHFLYNALQSIASLSLRLGAPKIYDLIYSLGSMMRYSMTTNNPLVTLAQEAEHVENYLILQQERFGAENLSLTLDLEERIRSMIVPKMILQPIVENMFKHAFPDGVQDVRIEIRGRLDEERRLLITLQDNGRGMPAERLEELRQCLDEEALDGSDEEGIGLRNVLARLRLQLGAGCGLLLESSGAGTRVTLVIPRSLEEPKEEEQ